MSDLSKVPFLASLDAEDQKALAQHMEKRFYEAGDVIYAEGTPGEGLYYIERGTVAVLSGTACDSEIMAHLLEGSTFGGASLLGTSNRANAVQAVTDCQVLVLTRDAFAAFGNQRPAAAQTIVQALLQRPPRSARQIAAQVLRPSPLCTGIADEALRTIAQRLRPVQFCADSFIFTEGQPLDALYLVESGRVHLLSPEASGRVPLREIGPNDFFAEDALLTEQASEMAAFGSTVVEAWALQRADFEELATTIPAAVLTMTRRLAARSEQINRQLVSIALGAASPALPQTVVTPAAVTRPVVAARPAPVARPVPRHQPLSQGLRTWLAELPVGAKLRLAAVGLLVGWLLLVSLPSALAAMRPTAATEPAMDARRVALVQSARGGARPISSGGEADLQVIDAAAAPVVRMSDLVAVQPAVFVVSAPSPLAETAKPPLTVAPTPTPTPVEYTVQPGDTLGEIAQRFNVDLDVLAAINEIDDPALIRVDQKLIIPGGAEQQEIAAKLAAAPRPTPTPAPARAAAPVSVAAAPVAPAKPALPFVWDGRLDKHNIRLEPANVAEGQKYYRLVKALFRDVNEPVAQGMPGGDHNIYIEVLDESGQRQIGAKALVRNGGTATLLIENKPFPEYGANFPMYGMMGSYAALVAGLPSDTVSGMGLPMKHHVSFFLTFQLTTK